MQIVNPATEEIIAEISEDTAESLPVKFQKLKAAQPEWSTTDIPVRKKIILRFSDLMGEQIESLALVLTNEVGKPLQQSRNEINGARTRIKWLAENAELYLSEEQMTKDKSLEEKISYEP